MTDFDRLERLGRLRDEGALTEDEFQKEKVRILNSGHPTATDRSVAVGTTSYTPPQVAPARRTVSTGIFLGILAIIAVVAIVVATILHLGVIPDKNVANNTSKESGNERPNQNSVDSQATSPGDVELARTTFHRYIAIGNQNDLGAVKALYRDPVLFYGKSVILASVMIQKKAYIERWPVRSYTLRENSLSVNCQRSGDCTASGLVDWTASSPARQKSASGVSEVTLGISGGLVTSEDGHVISRR